MKDGSVTFPLGSVNVQAGTRVRFFVREANFARKEIKALWTGYKKRVLNEQFQKQSDPAASDLFEPAACFVIPTLDRGNKFFGGKPGYESSTVARSLPGVTCVSGFYANGVIGRIDKAETIKVGVQGSASSYLLIGSKSKRPIYSPATAAAEEAAESDQRAAQEVESLRLTAEEEKRQSQLKVPSVGESKAAPRYENGELMWKRREVHAGRALTVSTVEWSVAEKMAKPSSVLEGYMWDKETEVDRFRERVPLANLVSQCRLSANDPTAPKPRNWIQPVNDHIATKGFVIIPEMKRVEPTTGSLRKKYDLVKLSKLFVKAEAPVVSVNCDQVLFGGALEDITTVRQATSAAAIEQASEDGVVVPPILASDLLLYPYQLYKQRLAGADAVNLVVGSLEKKDLIYLTKIAASLQLQTLVTVTSEVQIRSLSVIPDGTIVGVIVSNRELEDFSFDMTGEQAIRLLKSEALKEFLEARGNNIPVLVEGRVGIIERLDENGDPNTNAYLKELKDAGAKGVIVGGGLAVEGSDTTKKLQTLQEAIYR
jgi:indole-3-glycerol phosphate synthase